MAQYNYEIIKNSDGSINCYRFSPASDGIRYFVDNYGKDLAAALSGSGVFLGVAIAQKCAESAFGTSGLARNYNNFGSIMYGGGVRGASGSIKIGNKTFATFASPADCFKAYVGVLHDPTKKYISKGLLAAKTPQDQLMAIAQGGYCTEPPADVYYKTVLSTLNLALKMFKTGKIS